MLYRSPFSLVRLGWHDAGTYNKNIEEWPQRGGANGSLRFEVELKHGANAGLVNALKLLQPIKDKYSGVTYADLFQLASATAVEEAGGPKIPMKYGRMDVSGPEQCPEEGRLPDAGPPSPAAHLRDVFYRMGLNDKEIVALSGAHTLGRSRPERSGWGKPETKYTKDGPGAPGGQSWTVQWLKFDNSYFKDIKERRDNDLLVLPTDAVLFEDPSFKEYAEKYAVDQDSFFKDYAEAHASLSNLGAKFDPPQGVSDKSQSLATNNFQELTSIRKWQLTIIWLPPPIPPEHKYLVKATCDTDILGIVRQLKNGDIVQLYVSHLVEKFHVVPAIEYVPHVGGESSTSFEKESIQDCGISEKLRFEEGFVEAATPQEPFVSENLNSGAAITSVEELSDIGVAAFIGEKLGGVEENVDSDVAATVEQNLNSAPSTSIVKNSDGGCVATTGEQNLSSDGGGLLLLVTRSWIVMVVLLLMFSNTESILKVQNAEIHIEELIDDFKNIDSDHEDVEIKDQSFDPMEDCGVFIVAYAEYLSHKKDIPPEYFNAEVFRTRYDTLLWQHGTQKYKIGTVSDDESPDRPVRPQFECESSDMIIIP
ncbi:L-ascorbate peroxidase T, chloroplastic [Capsicum annuum]|nr:L-ascorbate peroxidase T, chloroplastic [Capsicum annuum]